MIKLDYINGIFESVGGVVLWLNVIALVKSKRVSGVHLLPTIFWSAWGFWNLFYYPSLNQWCSFVGGTLVVIANVVWLMLAWYYNSRKD